MFQIDHKVAVLGRTSLTTEFLLRLVKAVPGIFQEDAAAIRHRGPRDVRDGWRVTVSLVARRWSVVVSD
jgi:hypothetical protein